MYGHTVMQRAIGLGYESEWAQAHFPGRRERNQFYIRIGYRVPPGSPGLERLRSLGSVVKPGSVFSLVTEDFASSVG